MAFVYNSERCYRKAKQAMTAHGPILYETVLKIKKTATREPYRRAKTRLQLIATIEQQREQIEKLLREYLEMRIEELSQSQSPYDGTGVAELNAVLEFMNTRTQIAPLTEKKWDNEAGCMGTGVYVDAVAPPGGEAHLTEIHPDWPNIVQKAYEFGLAVRPKVEDANGQWKVGHFGRGGLAIYEGTRRICLIKSKVDAETIVAAVNSASLRRGD